MDYILLEKLCSAFGPSGCEDEVRDVITGYLRPYCGEIAADRVGNLIVRKRGATRRADGLVFAAHMDEVGFMAASGESGGRAEFKCLGGIDPAVLYGRRAVVGETRRAAVIGSGKPLHLMDADERSKARPADKLWLDAGGAEKDVQEQDGAEARDNPVSIGDFAAFAPNFTLFGENDGLVMSKALDDRLGCALLCSLASADLKYDCTLAFTVCEEIGCRGGAAAAESAGARFAVIVETTTAGDIPGTPPHIAGSRQGGGAVYSFMDGGTVYDRKFGAYIQRLAEENGVPFQLKTGVSGGNESRSFQTAGTGAKVAALSAPCRYLHSANVTAAKEDIEALERMLFLIAEADCAF